MRRLVACVVGVLAGCNLDASGLGGGATTSGSTSETVETSVAPDASTGIDPSSGGSADATGSSSGTTSASSGTSSTGADASSSGTDTGEVPMLACAGQLDLAACYDFVGVGDGMLIDRSGNGNDADAVGVGVVPGPFGEAATFDQDSAIAVDDSPSLDIAGSLTLEAWILVDALPAAGRFGILDNEGQYSFIIYDTDEYRCNIADGTLYAGPVVVGEWSHVACVYDGASLGIYVNGEEIGMIGAGGAVGTADTNPMTIGDTSPELTEPLDGAVGGVRVWSRALDPAEL